MPFHGQIFLSPAKRLAMMIYQVLYIYILLIVVVLHRPLTPSSADLSHGMRAVLLATQLQPLELQSDNDDGGGISVRVGWRWSV